MDKPDVKKLSYYVYVHRDVNGSIFYVGKGTGKRAWSKDRHEAWRRYVEERLNGKYIVEIIQDNIDEEDAEELEDDLINQYGRQLVNWINPGRQFNLEAIEEYHAKRNVNRKFFEETIPLENTNLEEAIKRYKIVLTRMQEYEHLVLEHGLVAELIPQPKFGEPRMLERLILCLLNLGRNQEALNEAENYFQIFPDAVQLGAGRRVLKKLLKFKPHS